MTLKSNPVKAVAYRGGDEGGCIRGSAFMEPDTVSFEAIRKVSMADAPGYP